MNKSNIEKYRKAEYKAARIWHSRHDFSILVTLNVHTNDYSRQGQCEQNCQLGVWMVTCLNSQGQAEQYVYTLLYFFRLCLFSVVFAFVRMPQLILHYVLVNSISCHNVTYLFPFSLILLQTFDVSSH